MEEIYKRFAIYYAPDENSELDVFGRCWLGWDPFLGKEISKKYRKNFLNFDNFVVGPKKYGFHGNLKAPFRLKKEYTYSDLEKKVYEIAKELQRFDVGKLNLKKIGNFIALVPEKNDKIKYLSNKLVTGLDFLRDELLEEEILKRNPQTLTLNQKKMLTNWGYPYVLDEFNFHLTLTDKIDNKKIDNILKSIKRNLRYIDFEKVNFNNICIFGEKKDEKFYFIKRFKLEGLEH